MIEVSKSRRILEFFLVDDGSTSDKASVALGIPRQRISLILSKHKCYGRASCEIIAGSQSKIWTVTDRGRAWLKKMAEK